MTALVGAVLALATLSSPPQAPMRLYGHVLRDNAVLLPGGAGFAGTRVSASYAAPGGTVELSAFVLGSGARGEWFVLDVPLGDGTTAPVAGQTVALQVDGDPVVSAQPVALAAVQRLDLFHVPGASITVLPVPAQVVVAGQTLALQLEVVAVTAQGLVTVPTSGNQGAEPVAFELVNGPPAGASVNPFGGQVVYTPPVDEAGVKTLELRVSLPPLETTVRVRVSVIPPACVAVPGVATSCTQGTGACQGSGFTTCDTATLLTSCDAVAGAPLPAELGGNSVDDNCDGAVDEGFADFGHPCAPAGSDRCALSGVLDYRADRTALECVAAAGPPVTVTCDDGVECTADRCDPAAGCVVDPVAAGTRCNASGGVCIQAGCTTVVAGMVCDQPRDLSEGVPLDVDLAAALDSARLDPACSGGVDWSAGVDMFVRVVAAADAAYRVVATPDSAVDARLVLHADGCGGTGACLGFADVAAAGAVESLSIAASPAARVLVLQVTSTDTSGHVSVLLERVTEAPDAGAVADAGGGTDGAVVPADAGSQDAATVDAGAADAAVLDAGGADGGSADAGAADAGAADAGGTDAAATDAGSDDAAVADAGGGTDAGSADAGDAGAVTTPDAGVDAGGGGGGGDDGGGRGPCACTGTGGADGASAAFWLAAAAWAGASRRRRRT